MLFFLRIWIVLCALVTAAGWILSAFRQLNHIGYLVFLLVCGGLLFRCFRDNVSRPVWSKWKHRFTRPAPALFLVLALAAILGGALYLPVNIDGYSYRIPRALHWIQAEGWHWIHTSDVRLNVVATGFDWLTLPLLLFGKSERAIFLINATSFLLLPGAIFMALSRLGVKRRVAWWWMWIIPAGFCYCMQAGSIANDMYAAVFTLAAIGFALRARETGALWDLWTSLLALALATGAKQTNIPFALPWIIAVAPSIPLLRKRIGMTILMGLVAASASILPISILNVTHGFPWQGFSAERDYAPPNAFWGIIGNGFWIPFSNLQPPIIPWAGKWNMFRENFLASEYGEPFRSFDLFGYLHRAASEQYTGIGCTVLILLILSWGAARIYGAGAQRKRSLERWIRASIWLGFFVFMAKVGINQCPRYLAPFYPFLAASFLVRGGQGILIRRYWWKPLSFGVILASIGLIVLSRQRPLFPAETMVKWVRASLGGSVFLEKVLNSYTFANSLRHELQPFLEKIPLDEKLIGYAVRMGDKEPWLWKPYSQRTVTRVLNSDTPDQVRALPLRYIVLDRSALIPEYDKAIVVELPSLRSDISTLEAWMETYDAELVASADVRVSPDAPPDKIHLVRLRK